MCLILPQILIVVECHLQFIEDDTQYNEEEEEEEDEDDLMEEEDEDQELIAELTHNMAVPLQKDSPFAELYKYAEGTHYERTVNDLMDATISSNPAGMEGIEMQ
jgi:hypothetical protein